jgi:hypothetical protein
MKALTLFVALICAGLAALTAIHPHRFPVLRAPRAA